MEITQNDLAWGKIAYNGYIKQTGGVSLVSGDTLPPFEKLKPEIQVAWAAAVIAVKLNQDMIDLGIRPEPTPDEQR